MPNPYRSILIIAILLTVAVLIHEEIYDPPSVPYTLGQYIADTAIGGAIDTTVFFGILLGVYFGIRAAYAGLKKVIRK